MGHIRKKGIHKTSKHGAIRIGDRFGRYVVASLPELKTRGRIRVALCVCDCDCGNRREVLCGNLVRNGALSCGCRKSEVTTNRSRTHCFTGTRIYSIWAGMIKRCENPKALCYEEYGGRGIAVCPEWRSSVEAFFDWAMANGYDHGLTIDRRDNDLGYSPDNCRWADWFTQQNNRRTTRIVEAFGERKSLMNWSKDPRCRVDYATLFWRFKKGKPIEEAMTVPARKKRA